MKRLLALLLCPVTALSLVPAAAAEDIEIIETEEPEELIAVVEPEEPAAEAQPNVDVVAVTDLIPERRDGLAQACRCEKTYDSLEEMVKDDNIEAVRNHLDPVLKRKSQAGRLLDPGLPDRQRAAGLLRVPR